MIDLETESVRFAAQDYAQPARNFLQDMGKWCTDRALTVEYGAVTLTEDLVAPHEAATRRIPSRGACLALAEPA
jgi:hypothetical protein